MASRYQILKERTEPEKRPKRPKPKKKKQLQNLNIGALKEHLETFYADEFEKALDATPHKCSDHKCPRGGDHEWGTDGVHGNEFCIKCFVNT